MEVSISKWEQLLLLGEVSAWVTVGALAHTCNLSNLLLIILLQFYELS